MPQRPEVKICGLTRIDDAIAIGASGAQYAGVVLAGGPRSLGVEQAVDVLGAVAANVRTVAVVGAGFATTLGDLASRVRLSVAQLHADPAPADVDAARRAFGGQVWAVVRVPGEELPPRAAELFRVADGVVLDAGQPGTLGGTGRAMPWLRLVDALAAMRGPARLILAGGLHADNVGAAVATLAPDIVDVSSGVERSPGVKDHERMVAFVRNARGTR